MAKYKAFGATLSYNALSMPNLVSISPMGTTSETLDATDTNDGRATQTAVGITPATDLITFAVPHRFSYNQEVIYNQATSDATPLVSGNTYYVITLDDPLTMKLANAYNDPPIDITGSGSGAITFKPRHQGFRYMLRGLRDNEEIEAEFNYEDGSNHSEFYGTSSDGNPHTLLIDTVGGEQINKSAFITRLELSGADIDGTEKLKVRFRITNAVPWT